jgi:hypothetical protein
MNTAVLYYGMINDVFNGNNPKADQAARKRAGAAWQTLSTKIGGVQEGKWRSGRIDPNTATVQFTIGGDRKTYKTSSANDKIQAIRAFGEAGKLPEGAINKMIDMAAYGGN